MKITASITINAPIQQVYEVFADIGKIEERVPAILKIEVLSNQTSGQGVRWRETRKMMGKEATEEMEMTSADPPNQYIVEAESHGTHYTSTYNFIQEAGSTRIDMTFEGKSLSLGSKLMMPLGFLMKGAMRKMLLADMRALKSHIEV